MLPEHGGPLLDASFSSYHASHQISELEIVSADWHKSSASAFNGSCFEVARLGSFVGVRDTKDQGSGPVLVFNQQEWDAFLYGAKAGEFDLL